MQDKIDSLTSEKLRQQNLIQQLENELHHQQKVYNHGRAKVDNHRRSSGDSGFGSISDPDEAIERQKALYAKDRMSIFQK